jgi:hypothetical protein
MPRVQRVDRGDRYPAEVRWIAPPSLPVREPAQVLDRGARSPWPFLYSYREDGRCVVNTAPRQSAYRQATEVGEAIM